MSSVSSFAPVASRSAKLLILGSMPGVASLDAGEYYAHPRNSFWPMMGSILGFDPSISYEARLDALQESGIALWDVLQSCVRIGSLDSAIESGTRVANDFRTFFEQHPDIRHIYFNGAEAENSYRRYVLSSLNDSELIYQRLPSTSPAHAGLSFEQKLSAWRTALAFARK